MCQADKINDFDSVSYDIFTPTLSHLTKAQAPRSTLPPEDIMFIIFNLAGVSFCVLALFGGWGVQFSAWALGFDESVKDLGFGVAWCAVVVLLDLGCRSLGLANSSRRSWLRFVAPSNGGQFFLSRSGS
jgi:hypothetical protein